MARITAEEVQTIPYGPLGIIALPGCEELAQKIDNYLVKWRKDQAEEHKDTIAFYGYLISLIPQSHASAAVREKRLSTNLSADMIYISLLIASTILLNTKCTEWMFRNHRTTILQI